MLKRFLHGLLTTVLSALFVLVCVELGMRVWLMRFADEEQFRSYASLDQARMRVEEMGESVIKYVPHRYIGFAPAPNYRKGENRHNALGFRGEEIPQPKPPGEYRIVCIGGSTTYTSSVRDHTLSFPSLLQGLLRDEGFPHVRVVNAGSEGYTTYESLVNFQFRVLDLDPDMVIVYHAINDVMARMVWPATAYRGDNSGYMLHSPGWHRQLSLWEQSTALRIVLVRLGYTTSPLALHPAFGRFAPSAKGWAFVHQTRTGAYPTGLFERVSPSEILRANPPVYFRRNLANLITVARYHDIQPVLATFAHSGVTEYGGPETDPISSKELIDEIEATNRIIRKIGVDLDVPVFEFAEAFPDDPKLFKGAVHVNVDGSRLKARLFADFLLHSGLLGQPSQAE